MKKILFVIVLMFLTVWLTQQNKVRVHLPVSVAAENATPQEKQRSSQDFIVVSSKITNRNGETSVTPNFSPILSKVEIFCKLLNSNSSLTLDGDLKILTWSYEVDDDNEPGFTAYVRSELCPQGLFSKVRMNSRGLVKEVIDCKNTTHEELATRAGIQGNILDAPAEENAINLAISGSGLFVEDCAGTIKFIRDGRFVIATDGTVTTRDGACIVLDKDGQPFVVEQNAKTVNGCTADGHCPAVVEPDQYSIRYQNSRKLISTGSFFKNLNPDPVILDESVEDLDDPESGPFGPNFEKIEPIKKPESCPN